MHMLINLDPVFPVMLAHFKSLLKPKFIFFFRFSPLSTDSHLSWISWLVYIHVEELDDSLYNKSRSITEYMPLHCDVQSLVLNIHSKIFAFLDLSFKVFLHKCIATFQFVSFTTVNTCIWILLISNCKCWNVPFRVVWFPLPYYCTAIFENTGSVTIRVSSLTTWMASAISGPLVLLFGMANTFWDQLSETIPRSLDNSVQIISGKFTTF